MNEKSTCIKCVLHSRVPNISINKQGLCNYCSNINDSNVINNRLAILLTNKFNNLITEIKTKKNQWDAIVMFSGGKDSTYLLELLKNEYQLKILAMAVIHPFVNEQAQINIKTVAKKLDIELLEYRIPASDYKEFMKYSLLNGSENYHDEFIGCRCCEFLHNYIGFKMACMLNVPLLVDGIDKNQYQNRFIDKKSINQHLMKNQSIYGYPELLYEQVTGDLLGDFVRRNNLFPVNLNIVSPLSFLQCNKEKIFDKLESIFGEISNFRTSKTNCTLVPFFDYLNIKKYDCITYIKTYSNILRDKSRTISSEESEKNRDDSIYYFECYKKIVSYVGDNRVENPEALSQEMYDLLEQCKNYLNDDIESSYLLGNMFKICDSANYLNIDKF